VVILVINDISVLLYERESQAPVTAHPHRPGSFPRSLERVKHKTGQIHVLRRRRGLQLSEYQAQALGVLRLDSGLGASFEKALQPLVSETPNHKAAV
jgi:hypothetical protein